MVKTFTIPHSNVCVCVCVCECVCKREREKEKKREKEEGWTPMETVKVLTFTLLPPPTSLCPHKLIGGGINVFKV